MFVDVKPSNYIVMSVITMLFFCFIFGLIALFVGLQVGRWGIFVLLVALQVGRWGVVFSWWACRVGRWGLVIHLLSG